jgi:hypothetical protein
MATHDEPPFVARSSPKTDAAVATVRITLRTLERFGHSKLIAVPCSVGTVRRVRRQVERDALNLGREERNSSARCSR